MSGPPTPEFQLEFLDFIQRVLDEGGFVATYKFALLMALADLSVEIGDDTDATLEVHLEQIARKFIEYYARQTEPYRSAGLEGVLYQNTDRQAKVLNLISKAQATYLAGSKPAAASSLAESPRLVRDVAGTVKDQPLWRLQAFGTDHFPFLYHKDPSRSGITLNPGIAYCFRRFHGFVVRMAQDGWLRHVRSIERNQAILGPQAADLAQFLFGSSRTALAAYRPILEELQGNSCFYCETRRLETAVDHFIPWSWYNRDLGHNFVLACRSCNSRKKDQLAAVPHLERWVRRNSDHGAAMAAAFNRRVLPADLKASNTIAIWAYRRAETFGGSTWIHGTTHEPLDRAWRRILAVNAG